MLLLLLSCFVDLVTYKGCLKTENCYAALGPGYVCNSIDHGRLDQEKIVDDVRISGYCEFDIEPRCTVFPPDLKENIDASRDGQVYSALENPSLDIELRKSFQDY